MVGALLERGDDLLVGDLLALEVALHQRVRVFADLVHQLLAVLPRTLGHRVRDRDLACSHRARRRPGGRPSCRRGRSRPATSCSEPIGISVATTCGPKARLSGSSVRKKSARSRSSMLTNSRRARSSSAARCHRRRRGTSTPMTALTTNTADSHTRSAPSASATKLESPGVSSRLTLRSCHSKRAERRRDRHLARLLVGVGVGDGGAVGHRAQPVGRAGLEQQRLVQRGLAGPAVADEGHVADAIRGLVHDYLLPPGMATISLGLSER